METYIRFEPSKEPLSEEYNKDKFYLFSKDRILVEVKDNAYIIPNREVIEKLDIEIKYIQCLGSYDGMNCYCGEIEESTYSGYEFIDLRTYSKQVSHDDFLVSAKAILLLNHERENQKCGICGSQMIMKSSGNDRAMICTNCDNMVWPKTAPAIIVAVTKGDKLLLAHNRMFPEGMYSVVAGFVEMGESFEQCVMREVYEEIGIKIQNVKYFGSQPWPFPNSMMIGFTAEYLEGDIKVDNDEIVDAKWFAKEDIPGKYRKSISISSELIDWFLNR